MREIKTRIIFAGLIILIMASCEQTKNTPLFEKITKDKSGIEFTNSLSYNEDFNIYTYRNFYNGGGVAIGDINNDSLPDIYFTFKHEPKQIVPESRGLHI